MTSQQPTPAHLLAFPSVSCSLHTLPQATSIHSVTLHPGIYAYPESLAKLGKALALSQSSKSSQSSGASLSPSGSSTATLPAFRITPPAPGRGGEEDEALTVRTVRPLFLLGLYWRACSDLVFFWM